MSDIAFICEWLTAGQDAPELRATVAQLTMRVGDLSLTQNEDVWSRTVRDSALVSAYPLALWLAGSWWRLNYEPLPIQRVSPSLDWRMGHEMGAANHGYVWPQVVFASDGEAIHIWAVPSNPGSRQSVRYLRGLPVPRTVTLADFQMAADEFISGVLNRLRAMEYPATDLAELWRLVQEDRAAPEAARERRIEAQMGYDPEECPKEIMDQALALESRMGTQALSELAPIYGRRDSGAALGEILKLANADGLQGIPAVPVAPTEVANAAALPWQRAVEAARSLRSHLHIGEAPIDDATLYGLLGLRAQAVKEWMPPTRHKVGLAVPTPNGNLKFVPRKPHPIAKRFEFSRFLGDYVNVGDESASIRWLASTDLATSRQKYQRAFAAEFLCPIKSLANFLNGDFSESAIEEAASNFEVSERTIESLLSNNDYIAPRTFDIGLPYPLAV